jgi:putative transposase
MRRLLTGHAIYFNRRHRRHGHLFQNRYKSILCQEDAYLLELVRYIHLNPLRAGLVRDMNHLGRYPFCGHGVIMDKFERPWQRVKPVLALFNDQIGFARRQYRTFVANGIAKGRRDDLVGGGLVRSAGGWAAVKALRAIKAHMKSDERILGDGDFVTEILSRNNETLDSAYALRVKGVDLDFIARRVAKVLEMEPYEVWQPGRYQRLVTARSLLCFWAVRRLGVSMASLSRRLGISTVAVSKSVGRGAEIARENNYRLIPDMP